MPANYTRKEESMVALASSVNGIDAGGGGGVVGFHGFWCPVWESCQTTSIGRKEEICQGNFS